MPNGHATSRRAGLDESRADRFMTSMADPDAKADEPSAEVPPPAKPLSPAAQRALAEAQARRAERERAAAEAAGRPTEVKGRGGLDPARYGDWEVKGVASDF
jgi:hypothetical protein